MVQSSVVGVPSVTSSSVTSVGDPLTATNIVSSIQSIPTIGISVTKIFRLSAAHKLEAHNGKCKNLHGHNYRVDVTASGAIHPFSKDDPESGMVKDFANITKDAIKVILIHDHKYLNDNFPNPTAEVLALSWLNQLRSLDPRYTDVTVWETDDCYATASVTKQ